MFDVYINDFDDINIFIPYFDDIKNHFVSIGNKDYSSHTTIWWTEAKRILDDFEYGLLDNDESLDVERVLNENSDGNINDDVYIIAKYYLKKDIAMSTIRGYSQCEWQNVYYEKKYADELKLYESLYFGMYSEVYVKDLDNKEGSFSDIITHNDLWDLEHKGELKKYFEDKYGEINKIYKQEGFIKTPKYIEIEDMKEKLKNNFDNDKNSSKNINIDKKVNKLNKK